MECLSDYLRALLMFGPPKPLCASRRPTGRCHLGNLHWKLMRLCNVSCFGKGGRPGAADNVTEEVQILKNRVELLEQKLQLALAPVSSLFPLSLDEGVAESTSFLTHSIQQLDRIDSLSEQIGFLEERLGTCEYPILCTSVSP
ncbi:hypothetical protein JZ751_012381 [Albula glossodonta]|uniref:Uncharacterized protein n=1 Tax=Albula glossodonta TaxID=121402 RepID=A0A8T2PS65_9TELE|nr:hypothetical protein JZ751_012381 [Albula glossodonta]